MSQTPRKIHIASQTYLRSWAVDGKLMTVDVATGESTRRDVRGAGFRLRWWGGDAAVVQEIETTLGRAESKATPVLRDPVGRWPLAREDRVALSQLLALHVLRSPAWRRWHDGMVYDLAAKHVDNQPDLADRHLEICAALLDDHVRAAAALGQTTLLASILSSMHWSLVEFDDDLLATSDQPVAPVSLTDAIAVPISPLPQTGFLGTLELRMPLSPRLALLLSWYDQPDDGPVLRGTLADACNLNVSTVEQADRQWMHVPHRRAPLLTPPLMHAACAPLSPQLLANYDVRAASTSRRRTEAGELLADLTQAGTTDIVRWVSVSAAQADSRAA